MSRFTPSKWWIFAVYLRVIRFRSDSLNVPGSHWMPPFAPPNGISTTAVFHVMRDASARTSLTSAAG